MEERSGREQGQGLPRMARRRSVAGVDYRSPMHLLDGVGVSGRGDFQVLWGLKDRQRSEEKGFWHKERCCSHHRLKSVLFGI